MEQLKKWFRAKRKDQHGFTLVELIVTFAMLAIFVTAAAACLPSVTNIYYRTRMLSEAQVIAQTALESMEQQLGVMRGVVSANNGSTGGHLTLYNEAGAKVAWNDSGMSGSTIEYISGNEDSSGYMAQLDTKGFSGYAVNILKKQFLERYMEETAVDEQYLITRFYEADDQGDFIGSVMAQPEEYQLMGEEFSIPVGQNVSVVRALETSFAQGFYGDFKIEELTYEIPAEAIKDGNVYFVNVSIRLVTDRTDTFSYTAEKSIYLQNYVAYQ